MHHHHRVRTVRVFIATTFLNIARRVTGLNLGQVTVYVTLCDLSPKAVQQSTHILRSHILNIHNHLSREFDLRNICS